MRREARGLWIGPSGLTWDGEGLTVRFDETTAPIPGRVRGEVRLRPRAVNRKAFALDDDARHLWRPIAPRADVEVSLIAPAGAWRGAGYFDTNAGAEPLEDAFSAWDWSRAHGKRDTFLFYDVTKCNAESSALALRIGEDGTPRPITPLPRAPLPPTLWRLEGRVCAEPVEPPRVRHRLEDTPFYSRTALSAWYDGAPAEVVHEHLSLDRLRRPIVRAMLPFRMPRLLW